MYGVGFHIHTVTLDHQYATGVVSSHHNQKKLNGKEEPGKPFHIKKIQDMV